MIRKVISGGGRFSTRLDTGERLRIVDTHGQQAVDFLCYSAELPVDRYNAAWHDEDQRQRYLGIAERSCIRTALPGSDDADRGGHVWTA